MVIPSSEDHMDRITYGSFPAAVTLDKLLTDEKMRTKVSRFLQDYNEGLAELHSVNRAATRKRLALLWRNDFLEKTDFDSESQIDNYVRNVISTYYRKFLSSASVEDWID